MSRRVPKNITYTSPLARYNARMKRAWARGKRWAVKAYNPKET